MRELSLRFPGTLVESFAVCSSGTVEAGNDLLFLLQSLQRLEAAGWLVKAELPFLTSDNASELRQLLLGSLESAQCRSLAPKLVTLRSHTMEFLLRWTRCVSCARSDSSISTRTDCSSRLTRSLPLQDEWLLDTLCAPAGPRLLAAFQPQICRFLCEGAPDGVLSRLLSRAACHPTVVESVMERLLNALKKDKPLRDK